MTLNEIQSRVNEMSNRTQFGMHIVQSVSADKDLIKPKHNPYYGRVRKVSIVSNITFADYANKVNGQANKVGEHEDFVPQQAWFHHLDKGNDLYKIVVEHNTTGENYLVYCFVRGEVKYSKTIYLLDGRIATSEEVADIIANTRPRKEYNNKGQEQVGLSEEKQVDYRTLAIENAVAICFDSATAQEELNAYIAKSTMAQLQGEGTNANVESGTAKA